MFYIQFFIISILISWFLTKLCIPFFQKNWSIIPNKRASHSYPVPFGGGIIFSLIGILGSLIYVDFSSLIFIPLILTGHLDDLKEISPSKRFFVQVAVSITLILYKLKLSPLLDYINYLSLNNYQKFFILLILIFIFTSIVNITNFSDGIDGLVASTLFIVFLTAFIKLPNQDYLIFILGALLGFLFWNWSPAKIFMGDSGSYFLGAIYFNILLSTRSIEELISFLILGTPIFADISITLIKRFFMRENIFKPHKLNLYQRLNQAGLSHSKISLIYLLNSFLLCFCYLFGDITLLFIAEIIVLLFGYLLDKYIAIDFKSSLLESKNK